MGDREGELGFRPPHPGEYLREDILPELGISVSRLADHLGVSRQAASRLVNERAGVSMDMAVRLGQAFKNGARFWLALQMQHDLWEAEHKRHIRVEPIWDSKSAA